MVLLGSLYIYTCFVLSVWIAIAFTASLCNVPGGGCSVKQTNTGPLHTALRSLLLASMVQLLLQLPLCATCLPHGMHYGWRAKVLLSNSRESCWHCDLKPVYWQMRQRRNEWLPRPKEVLLFHTVMLDSLQTCWFQYVRGAVPNAPMERRQVPLLL